MSTEKYENCNSKFLIIQCFSFKYLLDQELKGIQKLNPKKPVLTNDVPDIIHHNFNNSLSNSLFPTALKYAGITPVFKKNVKLSKKLWTNQHSSYFK